MGSFLQYPCTSNNSVATTGGSGSGLTVDINVPAGAVASAVVRAPGTGYKVGDFVNIATGDGKAGLSITAVGPGNILSFTITNPGTGYTSNPTISVPDSGNGKFYTEISNGSLTAIHIINSGTNVTLQSAVHISNPAQSIIPMSTVEHLGQDYNWQIDSAVTEPDGYVEPKKVKVSFYDATNDGAIDNPDAFIEITSPYTVSPQTGYLCNFVYFETLSDGLRYQSVDPSNFVAYPDESSVPSDMMYDVGQLVYFYSANVVKSVATVTELANNTYSYTYVLAPRYFGRPGRGNLKFQYQHNAGEERRLDPSKTNIIDVYVLSSAYDALYRNWLTSGSTSAAPLPPTSNALEEQYSGLLEPIKSVSDTIVYHHANYKVLFGSSAPAQLQATFKAVQSPSSTLSSNQISTSILQAINDFFAVENWDFGQTFNFGELATYVINTLTPDITNFVLVPKTNIVFGSLFEIACQSNEIFVSGATIKDIEVISSLTASQINTTASIVVNTIGT